MLENGITIRVLSQFGPDQKSVPQILSIINPAKIPCVDMPFCDDSIKRKIAEGGILVIENGNEPNKTVVGAILTHWIQKNKSGEFSIAFDKAMRNNRDMVARAIDSFKNCAFNEMRLSLVTIIVSSDDSLSEILLEKNFINGLDLTRHSYFSISDNGSKLTNLAENGHSGEIPKSDGAEIKKLRLALEKSDEVCRMAYAKIEELKKALKKAQENGLATTGEEPSNQVVELKEQLEEALEKNKQAQKKFNEWRDSKNQELEETQKTIANRDATIKRLDGEIIELSKLLGEKTQKVNELTKTADEPSEPAPETDDPYKEIAELITIASPDEQAEKIHKLIEKRLKKENLSRNSLRIANLAAAAGIVINSNQQQATVTDLAERMQCTTATVRSLAKELEVLGIAEKHKHSVKLKTSSEKTAEKNPAKEKKSLADANLVPRDLQILQIIIESGKNGIFQQEIIRKTGSNQSDISRAVRVLDAKGLVKNQQEGIRSKAIAQMDQILLLPPEILNQLELKKPEIVPEEDKDGQHQPSEPEKPEEKIAEPEIVQEPPKLTETKPEPDKKPEPVLMPLSDSSEDPELKLLESLPDNRIQQTKDYLNDCLEKGEEISLFVICSKAGVKKDQSELFVSALVKSMNKATSDPNNRVKAVKFSIDENDFSRSTIELLSETEFLNEFEKDKPPEKQPVEKIVSLDELKEKLRDKSDTNGTGTAEKPKRTLAQLKATSGLCDKQKEILEKLSNSGGSLQKKEIRKIFKMSDITLTPYLDFMAKLDVIKVDGEKISLKF